MSEEKRYLALAWVCVLSLIVLLYNVKISPAHDMDHPEEDAWYKSLMRPDAPESSCCGEVDAYWADEVHVRDGKTFAKITDDRPDEPRMRPHRDIGEEFEIPPEKLKWDKSNPTGHAILFLSRAGYVFCFVQGSGI